MRLEQLVNSHFLKLNENDKYILGYILNNKEKCSTININELAKLCNVSRTTILRMVKKLGFEGYSEFKVYMKWNLEKEKRYNNAALDEYFEDVNKTIKILKETDFYSISRLIDDSERIFVYGTGVAQNIVAQELKRLFLAVNKYFHIIEGNTELKLVLQGLNSKDLVFIISLSGNTKGIIDCIKEMIIKNVSVVSITRYGRNKLSELAQYNLYVHISSINLNEYRVVENFSPYFILNDILFREYVKYKESCK
ncbi:MurR/RpiR family transcriptional regulator [Thermobrachium celere]|uniref:MurR/RpiR family transcriptional regulator n=1 Tax=Thermobrachium celere TaxID=53422 RepID=UPI00194207BA|nr:MurR/RpiR family transcriptional regulator [Thermobrachium celere]GFR36672.1 RpiR family transcriptional regulator [Thermobrachium celere]